MLPNSPVDSESTLSFSVITSAWKSGRYVGYIASDLDRSISRCLDTYYCPQEVRKVELERGRTGTGQKQGSHRYRTTGHQVLELVRTVGLGIRAQSELLLFEAHWGPRQ